MINQTIADLLTVADVAKEIKKSSALVIFLERTGQLPAERTAGGVRIFRRSDVEEFIRRRERSKSPTQRV